MTTLSLLTPDRPPALTPDIVVVGASLGGALAGWRAAQAGCQVLLVAQEAWLGGQLTSQAVPPDEHALIEQGGASHSYLLFHGDMRLQARLQPGFLDRATMTTGTNPGDGWVSRLCFGPCGPRARCPKRRCAKPHANCP